MPPGGRIHGGTFKPDSDEWQFQLVPTCCRVFWGKSRDPCRKLPLRLAPAGRRIFGGTLKPNSNALQFHWALPVPFVYRFTHISSFPVWGFLRFVTVNYTCESAAGEILAAFLEIRQLSMQ